MPATDLPMPRWVKLLDQSRCIGCHACTSACKSENEVPVGVTRTYVKSVDAGTFPDVRRAFQVTRCNQREDAPCVTACPTAAMYRRDDGIVDFDKSVCIGCKACMACMACLPVRRDLHQSRGPLGGEVQHVRAPARCRTGAGVRDGLPG